MCRESTTAMPRDATLRKWVSQPPTSPIMQSLRDEERRRALARLDGARVLDLASEARVTGGIEAESVARVDFSPAASEYAKEVVGDVEFHTADPENPDLPFEGNAFDAAISIGPYDWRFLDVEGLTAEVHRVLRPDGRFTFSVPTPRSPYAVNDWTENRYYEPAAAHSLVTPDWRLSATDSVFQYPYYVHMGLNRLPEEYQEPFVEFAERASDELTRLDRQDLASYLVLTAEPLAYDDYLDEGLESLFRPATENGFWDPDEGKFVRGLEYDLVGEGVRPGDFAWSRDDGVLWRYAPFALMGALQWRTSAIGDERYDEQLRRVLAYFEGKIGVALDEMPSYGIGPLTCAFALADDVFDGDRLAVARDLFEHARERFDFSHAEDGLLAYGWSFLAERDDDPTVHEALSDAVWELNDRLTGHGVFVFENHTTRRHQNQMYACWGLARAADVAGQTGYVENVGRVLERTVKKRMRPDGAFIWEDVPAAQRARRAATKRLGFRPPHWDFLYSCHQTFFVNAVAEYAAAGGERDFDSAVARAMAWVYGESARGDLVETSGIGVPLRFLTTDGRLDIPDQNYKGSYEVGSYVMALTNLLAGSLSGRARTHS